MSPEIGIGAPISGHAGLAGGAAAKDGKEVVERGEVCIDEDAVAGVADPTAYADPDYWLSAIAGKEGH